MAQGTRNSEAIGVETDIQQRLAAAVAAILMGAFLVYGVAFASPDAIHNAAHDSRHAFSFPCH